nr:heterocycloanthracin/sonorensin family bacteriocin [Bacillus sp. UMB0893]
MRVFEVLIESLFTVVYVRIPFMLLAHLVSKKYGGMKMNNFQNELQMLNVGDFQANEAVSWDPNQYYMDSSRQLGFGIGGFGFGGCFGSCFGCFSCFNCFNCFRCSNCFRCGGRCGGNCGGRCGGGRCGGGRCGGR